MGMLGLLACLTDLHAVFRYYILKQIICGGQPIKFHLEFLVANNQADIQILKNMKASVEVRNSVCHSAVIFANAIMHCGTTVDTFLRENLEWLGRATNWAKFSATAGLGVIHRGHLSQVMHPKFCMGAADACRKFGMGSHGPLPLQM